MYMKEGDAGDGGREALFKSSGSTQEAGSQV
jgi:hypothetical protein